MYTNANITIYKYNKTTQEYTRQVVKDVFFLETKETNMSKTGAISQDAIKVLIPYSSAQNIEIIVNKSYVLRGICELDINKNTKQADINSINEFFNLYTITIFDNKDFGSEHMRHYVLSGK